MMTVMLAGSLAYAITVARLSLECWSNEDKFEENLFLLPVGIYMLAESPVHG